MRFTAAGSIALVLAASATLGCWTGRDPVRFGRECPVIVTGTIVDIEQSPMMGPRREDLAVITVHKVHKNIVADAPLEAGSVIRARMHSSLSTQRVSTDLRYPIGTRAIWLIQFGRDGDWHINVHPVQMQTVDREEDLRKKGAFGAAELLSLRRVGGRTVRGLPKAELFARWRQREQGDVKSTPQPVKTAP